MTTQRQIEANRRNARRSTGPRTAGGKAASRANALRHGLRAEGLAVLPNEDPLAYRERLDSWYSYYDPTNPAEAELVGHAAELSWRLDRASRYENALLTRRVREAVAGAGAARRRRSREAFGRLLPNVYTYHTSGPDGADLDALRAEVESTPEGCRLVLEVWAKLLDCARRGSGWPREWEFHVIRLLKRDPGDEVTEPEIVAIAVADRTLTHPQIPMIPRNWTDGFCFKFGKDAVRLGCELKPESREQAAALLTRVAGREIARLEAIVEAHAARGDVDAAEAEEAGLLALFDPSPEGERLRRYQLAIRRELNRTFDQLAKLRTRLPEQPNIHSCDCMNDGGFDDCETRVDAAGRDRANEADSGASNRANEANSDAAVQVSFGSGAERSVEAEVEKAPAPPSRPRPMTDRERAIARMAKKALRRR